MDVTKFAEFSAGARLETDVPGIGNAIWTDVSELGTVPEIEVTGFDHVVRIGGDTYVAMSSS